jgi:hypothetical protein
MPYAGSCLFRRETLAMCQGFDETMTLGEDYDLMVRCWERDVEKIAVDVDSLIYRRHSANTTRGNHAKSHVIVLKRRLDRIRAGLVNPSEIRLYRFQDYMGDLEGADSWTLSSVS